MAAQNRLIPIKEEQDPIHKLTDAPSVLPDDPAMAEGKRAGFMTRVLECAE